MVAPSPKRYPKTARLRAAPEFQAVFKNGLKRSGAFFRLYFLASGAPRLGLAVSKKAAPLSVTRNRIKRICRETFRLHSALPAGDYVLVAMPKANAASSPELRAELQHLLSRIAAPTAE